MENCDIEEPVRYEDERDAAEREESDAREAARDVVHDGRKVARSNVSQATTFNRWRIWDAIDGRWMHIGYDTRVAAQTAARKMNRAGKRYSVKRTDGR